MSITFDPPTLRYAVVEYLKTSKHIYDPVDTKPDRDGQYRLVCLVVNADEAERLTHLLSALSDGRYEYTVCVAEPDQDRVMKKPLSLLSEPLNDTP